MQVLGLIEVPWWGLLMLAILVYLLYACRDFNYFRKQGIEGPTPWPILGTMAFKKSIPDEDMAKVKRYADKGLFGEFFGGIPSFVVFDEKLLAEICVKEFTSFMNPVTFRESGTVADKMLGNLKGEHWKHVRSEMTPTFTTGKLKKMNTEVNRCGKTLAENLFERAKLNENVDIKEYTGGFSMDAIASTGFGIRVDSQKDRNNDFVKYASTAFDDFNPVKPMIILHVFFPELCTLLVKLGFSVELISRDLLDFFGNVTKQAIEMRKSSDDQSQTDFIQLMINKEKDEDGEDSSSGASQGLTTDEIIGNAIVFFVAGYDTTQITLSFLLYNLAINQACQNKLAEEILHIVGTEDNVDYSLLQEMPYLEQCINETLRIYPPATRINREVNKDTTVNGIFFRKGIHVEIPIHAIHHDPKKWPDPEKFDPERFTAENKKDRSPYHFIPFGYGPRTCIAQRLALMEMKIGIVHVLRKIKVSPCDKTKIPIVYAKDSLLLKAEGGIWLKAEPRVKK